MKFNKITLCFDTYGCPNRCKHCWINVMKNKTIQEQDIRAITNNFAKYTDQLEVYTWLREPDYHNYKQQWKLDNELSKNATPSRFELLSFYRLVRDSEYVEWLKQFDIKTYQLTIFGLEQMTDFYVGRTGAFQEIIKATNILLDNNFIPRWQMFVNKDNVNEIEQVVTLIKELQLEERSKENGGSFKFFIHTGSCCGENYYNYDKWITKDDLPKLPKQYFTSALQEESKWYIELSEDHSTHSIVSDEPTFFVSNEFNVYPNESEMSEHWKLGNLKEDTLDTILIRYRSNKSVAQHVRFTKPVSELVKACGDASSSRLFHKEDYMDFLLNKYCKEMEKGKGELL